MCAARIPDGVRAEIISRYQKGERSPARIAQEMGQHPGRVRRVLVQAGVYAGVYKARTPAGSFEPCFAIEVQIPADVVRELNKVASSTDTTARLLASSILTEAMRDSDDGAS